FLIFHSSFQCVVIFTLAHGFRFVPELSGRLLVFFLTIITQLFELSCYRGKTDIKSMTLPVSGKGVHHSLESQS
ncbi:TPA: hypothetical protein ACYQNV_004925, partial [Escherichia coli]